MESLVDAFGRTARDLRVSLTDRCNLRCTYCMPAEGLAWLPAENTLTDEEIVRLVRIAVERLGITKVRFTGGEPLIRPGLADIVAATKQMRRADGTPPETALTTNAIGLEKKLDALVAAGLDRVNISLDSLDRDRYKQLTRRDRLPDVLRSIQAASDAGLHPVKINAVIMRGINEPDVVPLAQFALEHGYQLRFIEQMPLGPHGKWERADMITQQELLDLLATRFTLAPASEARGTAPAELWQVSADDTQPGGYLGVIASVTNPFCAACDRTRLTSDGQMRTCLFSQRETDLRTPMREGATDEELAKLWLGAQWNKPEAHGIDSPTFVQPDRPMSAIGG